MKKLSQVEEAKALMMEAIDWSVMKWLTEKKKVRKASDIANSTLWSMQKEIKAGWSNELRAAYESLGRSNGGSKADGELRQLAKSVKEADDAAEQAHNEAEETFAKAEKILSTSLAREGCRKAIESWELYERAIIKAEAGLRSAQAK